jgi:hypothetical protein
MSRGAQTFRQSDLTKVAKAMTKAGVRNWRAEFSQGRMIVSATSPDGDDGKPDDQNEWDTVR